MPPTKKAAAAASKVAAKRARPSRSKVQEAAKRPRKKAPSSTPTANNPQPGTSTEGASMDPHLINVITQEVSDRLTTQMTREINNKFDQLLEMLRPSTENSSQTGFPYVPAVPKENTPAASMVSRAIVENTSSLTGTVVDAGNVLQIIPASGALSQSHFISSSVSPSALIPDKVKAIIWSGSYIDFYTLLNNAQDAGFKFQIDTHSTGPELSIVPKVRNVQLTIGQWILAWSRFTSVLCEKHPLVSTSLPHHMETVLKLEGRRSDWRYYDENFRQLVAKGEAKWGTTHLEIYMKAVLESNHNSYTHTNPSQSTNTPSQSTNTKYSKGVCFAYHNSGRCSF